MGPLPSHPSPRKEGLPPPLGPDGERKHAVEQAQTPVAELLPGMRDDLGITGRRETMASTHQVIANLGKVIDRAVQDDVHRPIPVRDGPVAAFSCPPGAPGHAEPETIVDVVPPRVAAWMLQ